MMTLIVIILALCAIGLFYTAVTSRKKRARQNIRPIDMQAFRAITSRNDEMFLRRRLPHSGVDDLESRVSQQARDYLQPPVMTIEPRFGDQHAPSPAAMSIAAAVGDLSHGAHSNTGCS